MEPTVCIPTAVTRVCPDSPFQPAQSSPRRVLACSHTPRSCPPKRDTTERGGECICARAQKRDQCVQGGWCASPRICGGRPAGGQAEEQGCACPAAPMMTSARSPSCYRPCFVLLDRSGRYEPGQPRNPAKHFVSPKVRTQPTLRADETNHRESKAHQHGVRHVSLRVLSSLNHSYRGKAQ